ncbi:MAG: ATP-binding protein [Ruminococcus sp.]
MIQRKEYLDELAKWKDEQVIKVVTGIRRCGKSTLLTQYQQYLGQLGVEKNQIIAINFEELENEELCDYRKLYAHIKERLQEGKMTYIFLDEIQKVPNFEKAVDSLYVKPNTDIYITGSNAYMLSGDLATLLTGRYVEISMLPLSFREYMQFSGKDRESCFAEYLKYGGFPFVAGMEKTESKVNTYLEGIYNTVIVRDIEDRQKRKEAFPGERKVNDITLLKTIAKYLASVIGSLVSVRNITNYLVSNGRKISLGTVNDYLKAMTDSFVFYPTERFDIAGKQILQGSKKYYMVDLGIRNLILPKKSYDLGYSLENIVYFELLRRGYRVSIGKYRDMEIDFVAQKDDALTYVQVTADMTAKATFDREINPLSAIKDNYKKIILTLDKLTVGNYDGIKVINLLDWLSV